MFISIFYSDDQPKHSGFQYKFKSGKGIIEHHNLSVGDIIQVRCGLEISREEMNYFIKKDVEMKLFTRTENMYFKMVTNHVRIKQQFVQVQFEMIAIPR